ncbi:MAG TPA: 2-oxoglutarate dehydrogenase, E2 component, dihydrolipoamide succinyltransferase, partial [Mycobacteriales bacterium]|nr:2-oxoglutarate dehydrogenase, E2 component, dihydrolipoamide succinyltransferase [Mycobacteriales bacterium]
PAPAPAPAPVPAPPAPAAPAASAEPASDQTGDEDSDDGGQGPSYVTPLVRRLAAEHGVDLGSVTGTGVGGRIRKQDVLDAASRGSSGPAAPAANAAPAPAVTSTPVAPAATAPAATAPSPAAPSRPAAAAAETPVRGSTEKLSRLRTVIAERMTESLRISAQLTTVLEVDLTNIARLRERARAEFEAREGVKLTYTPFFVLAVCEALREHPNVNASIDLEAGTVTYHDAVHLGIAVDTSRGLLVPVLKDASDLNLGGIARKVDDLARRTRDNHITPDELGGGTFTLTNTGSRGALFDTPIINQPQVGILGTGAVVKRPVVIDDPVAGEVIAVRHIAYLALTYDHRMVDGADAARFLNTVKARLEAGDFEPDLGL